MKNIFNTLILTSVLVSSVTLAQPVAEPNNVQPVKGPYVGLQLVTVVGGAAIVGYQFNRYFAAEVTGSWANDIVVDITTAQISVKGILPVSRHVNLYAKAGVAGVNEHDVAGSNTKNNHVLLTFGAGVGVYATKNIEFTFEGNGGVRTKLHAGRLMGGADARIGMNVHF